MHLDILVFAAHPDDAELSCSGTILAHLAKGYKVGIVDMTRGEKGTRGSAELRDEEAKASAALMGLTIRENLGFADCFFENNREHQLEMIKMLRKYTPDIVLLNAPEDRHPDHGRAAKLGTDACFLTGLKKIETRLNGEIQKEWRPQQVFHYIQDKLLTPDFVIDITPYFQTKINAIKAFKSQFYDPESKEPKTYISDEKYFSYIEARAMEFGHAINVLYGEGFLKQKQIKIKNLLDFI